MSLPITTAKTQLVAIAIECMAGLSTPITAGGVPYYWHTENRFPYFTCRTGADTVEWDSEDFDRDIYLLILRLVVGHLTAEYHGQNEQDLDTWIPALKAYINARPLLQSASYTTAVTGLIRARITAITGFIPFPNSGLSATQVGAEFTVECLFDETIVEAYL